MKNIYLNIYKPNKANLKKAKKDIKNNNVVGMPTETVYGLAGSAYSNKSVKKIFTLKKRPLYNPLIVHFKNLKNAKNDVIFSSNFLKYKFFLQTYQNKHYQLNHKQSLLEELLHYYFLCFFLPFLN